jgi:uncharacterized membrane protein YfcA
MGVASVLTAVAGAFAAEALSGTVLRIGFAALLVLTAAQMAWRVRRPQGPS